MQLHNHRLALSAHGHERSINETRVMGREFNYSLSESFTTQENRSRDEQTNVSGEPKSRALNSWHIGVPRTRSGRLIFSAVVHGTALVLVGLGILMLLMRG